MEGPRTSVRSVELHDNVAVGLHLLHITTLWVLGVHDCAVPSACAGSEDVHVKTVEMDWMTNSELLVGDRPDTNMTKRERQGNTYATGVVFSTIILTLELVYRFLTFASGSKVVTPF